MTLLKTTAKPLAPNVRLTNNDGTPTKEFHEFLTRLDAWLGKIDIPVVPPLPPEPPADGGEYVRVNGVWRLSGQTFVMDGLAQKDVTVPVGARAAAIAAVSGSTISNWLALRISLDGTTFLAGATDYTLAGGRHDTGTTSPTLFVNTPETASPYLYLSNGGDYPALPQMQTAELMLTRTASQVFTLKSFGQAFITAATGRARHGWIMGWYAGALTGLSIKALRFFFGAGGNFQAGSWVNVKWIY